MPKIVQIMIGPETSRYQSVFLGLGDDGVVYYWDQLDQVWKLNTPAVFEADGDAAQKRVAELEAEVERLRRIKRAALDCINNPAWAGICDEDIALEVALRGEEADDA